MRTLTVRLVTVLTALLLSLAVLAPAQAAPPKKEVKKAAVAFQKAIVKKNAKKFCALLPKDFRKLVKSTGTPCPKFVRKNIFAHFKPKEIKQLKRAKVGKIKVKGKKAMVIWRSGKKRSKMPFVREKGKWKVNLKF